jgi:hypothetical protein
MPDATRRPHRNPVQRPFVHGPHPGRRVPGWTTKRRGRLSWRSARRDGEGGARVRIAYRDWAWSSSAACRACSITARWSPTTRAREQARLHASARVLRSATSTPSRRPALGRRGLDAESKGQPVPPAWVGRPQGDGHVLHAAVHRRFLMRRTLSPLVAELRRGHPGPARRRPCHGERRVSSPHVVTWRARRAALGDARAVLETWETTTGDRSGGWWRRVACGWISTRWPSSWRACPLASTLAPDRPLTFLDHRLLVGNSLVGASRRHLPASRSVRQPPAR